MTGALGRLTGAFLGAGTYSSLLEESLLLLRLSSDELLELTTTLLGKAGLGGLKKTTFWGIFTAPSSGLLTSNFSVLKMLTALSYPMIRGSLFS